MGKCRVEKWPPFFPQPDLGGADAGVVHGRPPEQVWPQVDADIERQHAQHDRVEFVGAGEKPVDLHTQ